MKNQIYDLIVVLQKIAEGMTECETISTHQKEDEVEVLTIKECLELVKGLKESSLRKWIKQGKIPHKRAGEGKRGKFIIIKSDLLTFLKEGNNS